MTDRYADIRAAQEAANEFGENCFITVNSADIRALLSERDALIHDNSEYVSAANELATENQRLREALTEMIDVAERVDGWASFPQEAMDRARAALAQEQGGSDARSQ